ncbi:MAG TPA: PTS transporter subunit EIIC, partial [Candidatus Baltobacteraceae bacterium]|nr:PTS transporter subunit EIIC [Candidatus Baltobacteraceae bacterium]
AALVIAVAAALFDARISLGNALITLLQPLGRLGDTYAALLLITVVETLLWTVGIHGPATLAAIVTPVYLTLQLQNTEAFGRHQPLPHIVVVSLFLFVFPGGAGATLPVAALLAFSKVERLRKIGRLTIVPAIFNINEPLIFGLPLVLNPFLAIPFTVVPIVLATITYVAVAHGLVARPALYVPSSVPSLASTYLATWDVRAIALVAANIVIATLIYLPFVRAYERHTLRQAQDK